MTTAKISLHCILNNQAVINTVTNLNGGNKAISITCCDFSFLYTNIFHGKLMRIPNETIDFCFKSRDGEFIVLDRYRAQWRSRQKIGSFMRSSLKKAVKYSLNNRYFKLRKCLRQMDQERVKKVKKNERWERRFANVFRFIDDLTDLNDGQKYRKTHF